jgi:hypothetical protein
MSGLGIPQSELSDMPATPRVHVFSTTSSTGDWGRQGKSPSATNSR